MAGLVGHKCKIFYEDSGQVKPRIGFVIEETAAFLTIKNEHGIDALPCCKIIRIEVLS